MHKNCLRKVPEKYPFLALFGQACAKRVGFMHCICRLYAHVYDDKSKRIVHDHISTLSTGLSTVFHGKSLDFWPRGLYTCGKPRLENGLSTCGDSLTYFLHDYYKPIYRFDKGSLFRWKSAKIVRKMSLNSA